MIVIKIIGITLLAATVGFGVFYYITYPYLRPKK